jgi:hypothetical protein
MATLQPTKTVIPIGLKAKDIKILEDAISSSKKDSKCFIQTAEGTLFEVTGTIKFKKVTKI